MSEEALAQMTGEWLWEWEWEWLSRDGNFHRR